MEFIIFIYIWTYACTYTLKFSSFSISYTKSSSNHQLWWNLLYLSPKKDMYLTFGHMHVHLTVDLPPAPSPPSNVTVSQNGVNSVQVSWTPPSGEPTVTGYIIYYQQQDGEHNGSEMAGATTTTATITGLMTGATYSITMVATSRTLPSTVTSAVTITIGMLWWKMRHH